MIVCGGLYHLLAIWMSERKREAEGYEVGYVLQKAFNEFRTANEVRRIRNELPLVLRDCHQIAKKKDLVFLVDSFMSVQ